MKKKLLLSILGLGMTAASAFGQGAILLDNYNTYGPYVLYGAGSDGAVGLGLNGNYTMGIYYWNAAGDFTGSVAADPSGTALPSALNANLLLGTGSGSTAFFSISAGNLPGAARSNTGPFNVPGSLITGGQVWTFMIIAYEGPSYAAATYRGHSGAFTLTISDASAPSTVRTGTAMPGFSVFQVPEPSAVAFMCLGGSTWLFLLRRKS